MQLYGIISELLEGVVCKVYSVTEWIYTKKIKHSKEATMTVSKYTPHTTHHTHTQSKCLRNLFGWRRIVENKDVFTLYTLCGIFLFKC